MNAKTTTVTLQVGDVTRDFEFSHAERLLRMKNNGGWKLPESSDFEFVENALRYKPDTKRNQGKQKGERTGTRKTTSVKD